MSDVRLSIADRSYLVTCNPGEEEHLTALARLVDAMASKVRDRPTALTENQTLLYTSLMLADKITELTDTIERNGTPQPAQNGAVVSSSSDQDGQAILDDNACQTIKELASRVESLASSLEQMSKSD